MHNSKMSSLGSMAIIFTRKETMTLQCSSTSRLLTILSLPRLSARYETQHLFEIVFLMDIVSGYAKNTQSDRIPRGASRAPQSNCRSYNTAFELLCKTQGYRKA